MKPGFSLSRFSAESLRWMVGLYGSFVGAFVLVAPHRFDGAPYTGLASFKVWWGLAALVAGVALLAAAILRLSRLFSALAHGLAGLMLLALGVSFALNSIWTGLISYSLLAAGTFLAGLLVPARPANPDAAEGDLLALILGLAAVVNSTLLLTLPPSLTAYLDHARPQLPFLAALLLLGGGLILLVQLRRFPDTVYRMACLLAGLAYLVFGLLVSLPRQAWTGVALSWGGGLVLLLLPGLSRRLGRLDGRALRTRLAFALATATSVALILTAAVATSQEEKLATSQVLETRRIEALAIAQNVADYVQLNGARAGAVAAMAGRYPMEGGVQRELLEGTRASYPDMRALLTLDPSGTAVAAIGLPLDTSDWRRVAAELRGDPNRGVQVRLAGRGEKALLLLSAPVLGLDGRMTGILVTAFDSSALAERIARQGSDVFLADGYGRMIASRVSSEPGAVSLPGSLPAGWDRKVREGRPSGGNGLAAFAQVPGLKWVVAVEKPREAALAGVRRGRDMAFFLLLLVVPLAVAGGIVAARRIARPLGTLADAVGELTAGNPVAPLGSSDITEVARLSAAFRDLRDRLAARTRESERLAMELRARAEALAESDRRKDEFLAMLAHELRNPLGAIANASYVLEQAGPSAAPQQRAVAVIQRQIQHLVRLVDDLLDVSRITRGKIELRRAPVELAEVLRHAVEMTKPVVEAREHALRMILPAEPLPLHADATRLEQVFGNLIRNAAKYTEPGGRIEVEAWREGEEAVVEVRDNGIGISAELLPRMFDLFIQGDQTLDRAGGGLGIGLTLVRSLVEMHGGRVEARSAGPGQGSAFAVRLRLSPPDAPPDAPPEPAPGLHTSA